ncbi:MAG TPA: glycosyltransferase, partial [Blastocatellia bacterium]|nr:glycosyltransferase [Blastocatellia bacterium]
MATIMVFPFPEYGHLNPTLKLAKALKQAGHSVCYLGFAEFEAYLTAQGLEFIPILESRCAGDGTGRAPAIMQVTRAMKALAAIEVASRASSAIFRQIENELERITAEVRPDLLIVDTLIGGLAYKAAREFGVPSLLVSASYFEMPMLGRPAPGSGHPDLPVLVFCPEAFNFPGASRKPNHFNIEASIDMQRRELHAFPWDALDASKPLIYCSVGCQPHLYDESVTFYRVLIEALRAKPDRQLVLAIGRHMDCAALGPVPDNVLLINWAPQLELIKKASLMISHGGLGAVKECILLGVPMIVFPCRWDQPFNAARVVAHGLGLRGNIKQVTAAQVGGLIEAVAGEASFKRRVEAMSRTF